MSQIGNLLHISDLHFIKDLTEKGRTLWPKKFGLKSHSFGKIDAFSAKYQELNRAVGIDAVIATGDISTDGSEDALKTALEFIEAGDIYRGNPGRLVTTGLSAARDRRVVIPGNHDRYAGPWAIWQSASDRLETVFGTPTKYPYVVGYRRPAFREDVKVPALLFFVFDSTASELARASWQNPFYRIARGRVEDAECRWLVDQSNKIASSKEVMGMDGRELPVDYRATVRIALLHHHPVAVHEEGASDELTIMDNRQQFIDACFQAGIDIVLFGHEHTEYRLISKPSTRPDWVPPAYAHDIHFFCCPSTSEYSASNTGFYLFRFRESQFVVDLYRWKGKSFVLDASSTYQYPREIRPSQHSGAVGS
jgi:3',5'-cyclic AMP phosphodiesterase CpdA